MAKGKRQRAEKEAGRNGDRRERVMALTSATKLGERTDAASGGCRDKKGAGSATRMAREQNNVGVCHLRDNVSVGGPSHNVTWGGPDVCRQAVPADAALHWLGRDSSSVQ